MVIGPVDRQAGRLGAEGRSDFVSTFPDLGFNRLRLEIFPAAAHDDQRCTIELRDSGRDREQVFGPLSVHRSWIYRSREMSCFFINHPRRYAARTALTLQDMLCEAS